MNKWRFTPAGIPLVMIGILTDVIYWENSWDHVAQTGIDILRLK